MSDAEIPISESDTPYKGLLPYSEEDAPRFFGREQERRIITANLKASRLTVLYGPSGVGKSSVLLAGVVPQLHEQSRQNLSDRGTPAFVVLCFSSWREAPVAPLAQRVGDSVVKLLEVPRPTSVPSPDSLVETLQFWSDRANARLLIILDQFDEYFLYHPEAGGEGSFDVEFPRAANRPDLRVNFLISIREDALAMLDRFKGRIPNILSNYLRIGHLDRAAARAAIVKPLKWYNAQQTNPELKVGIERALVKEVLKKVRTGQVVLGEAGRGALREGTGPTSEKDRIETPYLQLIMTRLWEEEKQQKSRKLRLDTLTRLGGAEQIIRTHLDRALSGLSLDEQKVAATIFDRLVTPSGYKIAQTLSDLAQYAKVTEAQVGPLLVKLSTLELRILRQVDSPANRPKDPRYQIYHDALAAPVLDWRARFVKAREVAEAEAEVRRQADEVSRQTDRRWRRRVKFALGAAVMAVILMALVVLLIANASQRKINLSRLLAAQATNLLQDKLDLALLLSLEANRLSATPEVRGSLLAGLASSPQLITFLHHSRGKKVQSLAFRADHKILASGSEDGTIVLWDLEGGLPLVAALKAHEGTVYSLAFSPVGNMLASGGKDGNIMLWDGVSGERLGEPLLDRGKSVFSVAFSKDGGMLASGTKDGTIILWDLATRRRVNRPFQGHTGNVYQVAFSPDGKTLASCGEDRKIFLWHVDSGRPLGPPLVGHQREVTAFAFSPDGTKLASGGMDSNVILWDVAHNKQIGSPLQGHTNTIFGVAFTYGKDEKTLASGSSDKSIILWDVTDPEHPRRKEALSGYTDSVWSLAVDTDNGDTTLASGTADGTIILWGIPRANNWLGRGLQATPGPSRPPITAVAFSPDGKTLASGSGEEGTIILWDTATRKQKGDPLPGQTGGIDQMAFGTDGKTLVSASTDGTIFLWELSNHRPIGQPLRVQTGRVAFSPDLKTLALGSTDGTISFWNLSTQQPIGGPLKGHAGEISCVAFSPDGKILASGSSDDTVILWDVSSHQPLGTLAGHASKVLALAFSPDGKTLASGSADKTILLWNVATRQRIGLPLSKHRGGITSLAFTADGKTLVSGSYDKTIILWDVDTNEPVGPPLREQNATIRSLAMAPDGKKLASGSDLAESRDNWRLILWDLTLESWRTLACSIASRNLTPEEADFYSKEKGPDEPCPVGVLQEADAYALAGETKTKRAEAAFLRATELATKEGDPVLSNRVCWYGSIDGFARLVLPACEQAVKLASVVEYEGELYDSRGLARAILGYRDGAIDDFAHFLKWAKERPGNGIPQVRLDERQVWISELKAGRNPFDDKKLLKSLRGE